MPIDTGLFMEDATQNMVALLDTQRAVFSPPTIKKVSPMKGVFKGLYPSIEVDAESAEFERIESGGGYMIDIFLDIYYWHLQSKDESAKKNLNQRLSQIALFIASHPRLNGYADDVVVEALAITPLDVHPVPIIAGIIRCRVRKVVVINYE